MALDGRPRTIPTRMRPGAAQALTDQVLAATLATPVIPVIPVIRDSRDSRDDQGGPTFGPDISWPNGFRRLDTESRRILESGYGPVATAPGSTTTSIPVTGRAPQATPRRGYQQPAMDDYGYGDPGYSDPSYDGPRNQFTGPIPRIGYTGPQRQAGYQPGGLTQTSTRPPAPRRPCPRPARSRSRGTGPVRVRVLTPISGVRALRTGRVTTNPASTAPGLSPL